MRGFKLFSVIAVAALLLSPASMFARSHFSFSLNMFDRGICMAPSPPPPVFIEAPPPVFVPAPVPVYQPPMIVNEYHQYYYSAPKQVQYPAFYY